MKRRNWNTVVPKSLPSAMEESLRHAVEKHNRSTERVAELMSLPSHWTLYKWVSEGRMPAVMIPAFEHACGINLVTRWLASSASKLLIDMPTGRNCDAQEINALQMQVNTTINTLLAFYGDNSKDVEAALAAVQSTLEAFAFQRANVIQHSQPTLDLGGQDDE